MRLIIACCLASVLVTGCDEPEVAVVPEPVALTREAAGHFCQMTVLDHPGPKAQAHLVGYEFPLWFSQVRDALAFDRLPEQTAAVSIIYVHDMGAAASWDRPGDDNWIPLRAAVYVVGSDRSGGMGAPELVPFADRGAAEAFARRHGGTVIAFADIEDAMVLGPVEVDLPAAADDGRGLQG